MAETTGISWADHTWSPWTGCTKVSPACDGCYAAHLMDTRMGRVEWGEPGVGEGTRSLMSDAYWRQPILWDRAAAKVGTRPFVFPSLCDPFDTAVPAQWRWRFVELMEATPHLVWLLLTKRLGNVAKLTDPMRGERPLPENVAIGGTFCNQAEWDRDWWKLRDAQIATGAMFTFGSFEPMLGIIDMLSVGWMPAWVIGGGETDQGEHKARPVHLHGPRLLRDQCAETGVPFHWKQWGEWIGGTYTGRLQAGAVTGARGERCQLHDFGDGFFAARIGKKAAGRLLDGAIYDARPEVRHA